MDKLTWTLEIIQHLPNKIALARRVRAHCVQVGNQAAAEAVDAFFHPQVIYPIKKQADHLLELGNSLNLECAQYIVVALTEVGIHWRMSLVALAINKDWALLLDRLEMPSGLFKSRLSECISRLRYLESEDLVWLLKQTLLMPDVFRSAADRLVTLPIEVLYMAIEMNLAGTFLFLADKMFMTQCVIKFAWDMGKYYIESFKRRELVNSLPVPTRFKWVPLWGTYLLEPLTLSESLACFYEIAVSSSGKCHLLGLLHPDVFTAVRLNGACMRCFKSILETNFKREFLHMVNPISRAMAWAHYAQSTAKDVVVKCRDGEGKLDRVGFSRCDLLCSDPWAVSVEADLTLEELSLVCDHLADKQLDKTKALLAWQAACVVGLQRMAEAAVMELARLVSIGYEIGPVREIKGLAAPEDRFPICRMPTWDDRLEKLPVMLRDWVMAYTNLESIPPWVLPRALNFRQVTNLLNYAPSDAQLARGLPDLKLPDKRLVAFWCAEKGYPLSMKVLLDSGLELGEADQRALMRRLTKQGKIQSVDRVGVLQLFPDLVPTAQDCARATRLPEIKSAILARFKDQ